MIRSCFHATLTHCELRMLAMWDGILFASFRQRALLTIFQHSHASLSPSQTTGATGMANSYFSIWLSMGARIVGWLLARQGSGAPLFSFCSTWLRRGQHLRTAIAAPMIYFKHLRFGQMRVQSPDKFQEPDTVGPVRYRGSRRKSAVEQPQCGATCLNCRNRYPSPNRIIGAHGTAHPCLTWAPMCLNGNNIHCLPPCL